MSSEDRVVDLYRSYYSGRDWKIANAAIKLKEFVDKIIIDSIINLLK